MNSPVAIGAFAWAASDALTRGLVPIPVRGKKPCIKGFQKFPGVSEATILAWIKAFVGAQLGILCKPSRLVVVDIDNRRPELLAGMLEIFGDTRLIVRTPRGFHLYYRAKGDERACPQSRLGIEVDIKAGPGAYVLAPPSEGEKGGAYTFERGSWNDLPNLPPFNWEALKGLQLKREAKSCTRRIKEGSRNISLFQKCQELAQMAKGFGDFHAMAKRWAIATLDGGPEDYGFVTTVKQVWDYELKRRKLKQEPGSFISHREQALLAEYRNSADGHYLLGHLRHHHGAQASKSFAISPEAMAKKGLFKNWTSRKIRLGRDTLLSAEFIKRVHKGKRDAARRQFEPDLYELVRRSNNQDLT